jgi:biopolymer transport protein ExbB
MEGRKIQFARVAGAGLAMVLSSTPAFAQENAGGLDWIGMFEQMGPAAIAVAVILFIMSFWSVGVAIERFYTFNQATKQSKMYAPLVAKHLKEGRLKEAIALSTAKEYRYSHLAKVVLAGLQEYQFQQESGANLSREDLLDTVRRSIQRATALTSNDLKKGVSGLATIGATAPFVGLLGTVVGVINAFVGSARRDRARPVRRHPGGVVLQLPVGQARILQRRDGQLVVGDGRLLHQEDGVREVLRAWGPEGLEKPRPQALKSSSPGDLLCRWTSAALKAESNRTSTSHPWWTSCWCC